MWERIYVAIYAGFAKNCILGVGLPPGRTMVGGLCGTRHTANGMRGPTPINAVLWNWYTYATQAHISVRSSMFVLCAS